MASDVSGEPAALNFIENDSSAFNNEEADTFETQATIYETTRTHISSDNNIYANLAACIHIYIYTYVLRYIIYTRTDALVPVSSEIM
jgi:hypothetical protein